MFSGAGASHCKCSEPHPSVDVLAQLVLVHVVRLKQQHRVKVAITNVTENRG